MCAHRSSRRGSSRNTLSRENSGSFLAKYIRIVRTYTPRPGRVVSRTDTNQPLRADYTKIPSHIPARSRRLTLDASVRAIHGEAEKTPMRARARPARIRVRTRTRTLVCACIGSWSIAERVARDGDGYYSMVVVVVVASS